MAGKVKEFTEVDAGGNAADNLDVALPETHTDLPEAAETATAKKMSEIFGENDARNQKDELEEEGVEGPNNPDGEEIEEEGKEKEASEEEVSEDEDLTPEEATEKARRQDILDKFDPNLKQIAKDLGAWSQNDIDDFIVSNPVLARITFAKISDGYNALSQQYARGAQAPAQAPQQNAATNPSTSVLDDLLSDPKKLAQLQEVAGSELTEGFIKPMLAERARQIEDRAFIDDLRKESFVRDINETFTAFGVNGFSDFYGKNGEVNEKQQQNRFAVGQLADQIRTGAKAQNVSMTVREALQRAHLIATADTQKAQARREVQKQVQSRSRQITARPTARVQRVASSSNQEDTALQAVADFWSENGGN